MNYAGETFLKKSFPRTSFKKLTDNRKNARRLLCADGGHLVMLFQYELCMQIDEDKGKDDVGCIFYVDIDRSDLVHCVQ